MLSAKAHSFSRRAFSLVEVVIALGVTSFAVLALIGTLPTGIKSVQDSSNESARANILQQIRAELQEVNFGSGGGNILSLTSQTNYYDNNGDLTNGVTQPYYIAYFATATTSVPGSTSSFQTNAAQTIQVMLTYPYTAPAANRVMSTNYLLAARQKNY